MNILEQEFKQLAMKCGDVDLVKELWKFVDKKFVSRKEVMDFLEKVDRSVMSNTKLK